MPTIKIGCMNVEWMCNLYKPKKAEFWPGPSKSTGLGSKPKDVPNVLERLANTIIDVDADIMGIMEGPQQKDQMELFVTKYLDGDYRVYSMPSGRQSVHALVKKSIPINVRQVNKTHAIYRHLNKKLEYYGWGDIKKASTQKIPRKPVVLTVGTGKNVVEIMFFHTKSKISKLKRKKQYTRRDKVAIIDALRSRQKLSAEIAAIRRYITHAVLSKRVAGCVILGDLNDGPHRDIFEDKFLIHNIVDELRGGFDREPALVHHAFSYELFKGKSAYTAKFKDPTRDDKIVKVLLDHVLVTTTVKNGKGALRLVKNSGKIEHTAYDANITSNGKRRDDRPSDHKPISARFSIK